jgi:hypothetical protein
MGHTTTGVDHRATPRDRCMRKTRLRSFPRRSAGGQVGTKGWSFSIETLDGRCRIYSGVFL